MTRTKVGDLPRPAKETGSIPKRVKKVRKDTSSPKGKSAKKAAKDGRNRKSKGGAEPKYSCNSRGGAEPGSLHRALNSSIGEIRHEELMALPVLQYTGTVVLVSTAEDLARAARDLRGETIIGFDTETQPVFQKGQGQKPPSLVQMASAHAVYLFQLRDKMNLPLLAELLAASHIVKAGVAVAGDIAGLKRVFAFAESNMVDIGEVARRQGMHQTGLRNLAAMMLGARVSKGCRTSNWGAHVLSQQQISYAATDAHVGRELYLDFIRRGFPVGTS
jgi:hypothetical protein